MANSLAVFLSAPGEDPLGMEGSGRGVDERHEVGAL
jgi:hypothetical protein